MPALTLPAPRHYKSVYAPFVYVRASASTEAEMLGVLLPSDPLLVGAVWDGWLRTYDPYEKGVFGWVLEDGRPLGLPVLMKEDFGDTSSSDTDADGDA